MRVQTTKDVLEEKDIADILLNHEQHFLPRVEKLKRYYAGEHDILKKEQRADSAPNNMIVANYCEYIANMSTGFFMGRRCRARLAGRFPLQRRGRVQSAACR